ncbi:Hypothetical protein SRAE_1000333600 [Strongyloides ratti]|uniref:Uncharacterized protein n=1 Tax=Strongyloides ratti TaxID=34506 RepID=A0A090LAB3_STRRB|nr:Hypothetical protein SRAE_1000333600 [Strongyloides ratti]CEF65083.1 Hypothetical protein SRAE_1000333600 [Strongyloides ratti]
MSRDRRSRRARNKSRDLESRRRSRRRNHSARNGRTSSERRKGKSSRTVSRGSIRHRYKVRDGEQSLPDPASTNLQQQQQNNTPVGEEQQQNMANGIQANTPTIVPNQIYPTPVNYDPNQKAMGETTSKSLENSNKQSGGGSFSESTKTINKRVKRTTPNFGSNYNSFTITSQKVDGKIIHSITTTTTENIPRKLHFDCDKNVLGNKNILDNFEIQKICKNIQNGIKFGNCPKETITPRKYNNKQLKTFNDGIVFKTKDDVKLNDREIFLAKMRSLQKKIYIS